MQKKSSKTAHVMSILTNKISPNAIANNQLNSYENDSDAYDAYNENPVDSVAINQPQLPMDKLKDLLNTPAPSNVEIVNPNDDPIAKLIHEQLLKLEEFNLSQNKATIISSSSPLESDNDLVISEPEFQSFSDDAENDNHSEMGMITMTNAQENTSIEINEEQLQNKLTVEEDNVSVAKNFDGDQYICNNVVEEIVKLRVEELMPKLSDCMCARCKCDVIAFALNQLEPKYVVSTKGELIAKLYAYENQHSINITSAVTKACVMVNNSPRHK